MADSQIDPPSTDDEKVERPLGHRRGIPAIPIPAPQLETETQTEGMGAAMGGAVFLLFIAYMVSSKQSAY